MKLQKKNQNASAEVATTTSSTWPTFQRQRRVLPTDNGEGLLRTTVEGSAVNDSAHVYVSDTEYCPYAPPYMQGM